MMRDLILSLPQTNYWTLGISVSSIIFLSIGRDYVNPWFKKRSPVPLPIELILVNLFSFEKISTMGLLILSYSSQELFHV